MDSEVFEVRTGSAFACVDITERVSRFVAGRGDGLCNVFVPHATAGVAIFELGSGTEQDLQTTIDELLPRDDGRWRHRHGTPGHGADHVLPALVAPSVTVPVLDGGLALGTWQSLVLVDSNGDNPTRTVRMSFVG